MDFLCNLKNGRQCHQHWMTPTKFFFVEYSIFADDMEESNFTKTLGSLTVIHLQSEKYLIGQHTGNLP